MEELPLEEVIAAYYDCRKLKRNSANALKFELDYERNCIELWRELNERRYTPRRSIVFVVEHPVKREIFAADFRDRVVHHLIARRIYPLLEEQFLYDSYATQKGKGTLMGIKRIAEKMRQCSENYTRDCYVMKIDIQGFFMSLDKQRLYEHTCAFLDERYHEADKELLFYMLRKTIFNRPEKNCIRKVPKSRWAGLPPNKSLFGTGGTRGLPIGNLTSQLLALLYLDPLDHLITEEWGIEYYGRYVDDMVLLHPSKERLLEVKERIDAWLRGRGLTMHPKKMYLQHYSKGVQFVGGVIMPGRTYVTNRALSRIYETVHRYNQIAEEGGREAMESNKERFACSMNSYLGMFRHYAAFRVSRKIVRRIHPLWYEVMFVRCRGKRVKVRLRNEVT